VNRVNAAGAQALYEQALIIFRELGDRWGIAGTLADLGSLARELRNYSRAHTLFRESIKIFQELDHKRGVARLLECFCVFGCGTILFRTFASAGGCSRSVAAKISVLRLRQPNK